MIVLLIVKALGSVAALATSHFAAASIFYVFSLEEGLVKNRVAQVEAIKAAGSIVAAMLVVIRVIQTLTVALILAAIWWPS